MAKEKEENRKPYEVLTAPTVDGIEAAIKKCVNLGHFELVGSVTFGGGNFVATMKNTAYVIPPPS